MSSTPLSLLKTVTGENSDGRVASYLSRPGFFVVACARNEKGFVVMPASTSNTCSMPGTAMLQKRHLQPWVESFISRRRLPYSSSRKDKTV